MKQGTVLVACELELYASSISRILELNYEVVCIHDCFAVVEESLRLRPDCVVIELGLPLSDGLTAAKRIKATMPATRIVLLGRYLSSYEIAKEIPEGISAYVSTHEDISVFMEAIDGAFHNKQFRSTDLVGSAPQRSLNPDRYEYAGKKMTPMEFQVVKLLSLGLSLKEASVILDKSIGTIAYHKYRAMKRLGLKTNPELFSFAVAMDRTLDNPLSRTGGLYNGAKGLGAEARRPNLFSDANSKSSDTNWIFREVVKMLHEMRITTQSET